MYPFIRMGVDLALFARAPRLGVFDTHVTTHRIWPWDLDMFAELNNGRTLTLYDVSRTTLAVRCGLWAAIRREGWGLTVAGSSVRYRRRVRVFQKVEVRARALGWDDRFLYVEQSMWRGGVCCSHILLRTAATDRNGIVEPARLAAALGVVAEGPELPAWVRAWTEAEALRPWPPMPE